MLKTKTAPLAHSARGAVLFFKRGDTLYCPSRVS